MIRVEEQEARGTNMECGLVSMTTTIKLSRHWTISSWKRHTPCRILHFCKHVFFSRPSSHQKHMPSSIISEGVHSPSVARSLLPSRRSFTYPKRLPVSLRWSHGHWGRVGAYTANDLSILVYVRRLGVRRGWSVHRT